MRKDRQKAEQMRRSGKSYRQIKEKLGIPTSTLATWFSDKDWSKEVRDKLAEEALFSSPTKLKKMVAATRAKYSALHESYRQEAIDEFPELRNDPLFIAGLMLYWGEGDRKIENGSICLSNSDPAMIRIFYRFLLRFVKMPNEKIKFHLILYPDLVDLVQKNFWSTATGIPQSQFTKSVYIKGRHATKRLSYGVGLIKTSSRKQKEKLMKWIELYKFELANQPLEK